MHVVEAMAADDVAYCTLGCIVCACVINNRAPRDVTNYYYYYQPVAAVLYCSERACTIFLGFATLHRVQYHVVP